MRISSESALALFHDASVDRIRCIGNALHLEVEAFSTGPGQRMLPALIVIHGIDLVLRDGEGVGGFRIESGDAEIYGINALPEGVELMLFWHEWKPELSSRFADYRFPGADAYARNLAGGLPVLVPEAGDA